MSDPLELGRVTDRRPPFKYSALTRVWFSDTDAQGVVYYGRYLPYFDHARTEYHRHLGSLQRRGIGVRDARAAGRVPRAGALRRPDRVLRPVSRIGRTSITHEFAAYRLPDDELMVTATQTSVLIDRATRRPLPVPEAALARVRAFEGERPRP